MNHEKYNKDIIIESIFLSLFFGYKATIILLKKIIGDLKNSTKVKKQIS